MANDFSVITPTTSLTRWQKKAVGEFQFVPLAYFLPLKGSSNAPNASSSSHSAPHTILHRFMAGQSLDDPLADQADRVDAHNKAPHFHRWDQVVLAFTGGLMPMMCTDNPIRLADYSAFIMSIITEHSRNEIEWPILLSYIEAIRRSALLKETQVLPEHKVRAASHSLMETSKVFGGDRILNREILGELQMIWTSGLRSRFRDDFVDESILTGRPPQRIVVDTAVDTPSPPIVTKRENLPPPTGFTHAQWEKAITTTALQKSFCRNFLLGFCKGKCSRSLPHLDAEKVKGLLPF
jgi:hypothetical protein